MGHERRFPGASGNGRPKRAAMSAQGQECASRARSSNFRNGSFVTSTASPHGGAQLYERRRALRGRQSNYVSFSRTPLPQVSQVIPYTTKGIVVYVTSEDARFDILLINACIMAGIVTVICMAISGELTKRLRRCWG